VVAATAALDAAVRKVRGGDALVNELLIAVSDRAYARGPAVGLQAARLVER
jgi:hypothetical protein